MEEEINMESLTTKERNPKNLPIIIYGKLLELDENVDTKIDGEDTTYQSENFTLTLHLEKGEINIRNIEVFGSVSGARVIEALKELASEYQQSLYALNVKDTAIGFWEKLGFELVDGSTYACNL